MVDPGQRNAVSRGDVTELLLRWSGGNARVLEHLMPIVYKEQRRLAQYHLQGKWDAHTLPGTALAHELCLRLCEAERLQLQNRAHFFAVAAQMMRRILVDHARRKGAAKRGGLCSRAAVEEALTVPVQDSVDLLALDESLEKLAAIDQTQIPRG
jgi:RNA polymerase sigma factor (TIGR02999 family)